MREIVAKYEGRITNLGNSSKAQGNFDLIHTIHSREAEGRAPLDALGFSEGTKRVIVEWQVLWKERSNKSNS